MPLSMFSEQPSAAHCNADYAKLKNCVPAKALERPGTLELIDCLLTKQKLRSFHENELRLKVDRKLEK